MGRCLLDKGRFSMKKIVLLVLSLCLVVMGCSKPSSETENNDITQTAAVDSAKDENDNRLI